jgi:hypothetical protein
MKPTWIEPLVAAPDRLDAALTLASRFISAPLEDRVAIAQAWSYGVEWAYPSPWRLACQKMEQGSSTDRIVATLVLNALDTLADSREEIMLFAVVHNSCALCGLDADRVFEEVAAVLPERAAIAARTFAARPADLKSLEAFLLTVSNVDGEPEIRQTSLADYETRGNVG